MFMLLGYRPFTVSVRLNYSEHSYTPEEIKTKTERNKIITIRDVTIKYRHNGDFGLSNCFSMTSKLIIIFWVGEIVIC